MTSVCVYGPGCCAGGTATQAVLLIAGEPESPAEYRHVYKYEGLQN